MSLVFFFFPILSLSFSAPLLIMSESLIRQNTALLEAQSFHSLVLSVAPGCLSGLTQNIETHNGPIESTLGFFGVSGPS